MQKLQSVKAVRLQKFEEADLKSVKFEVVENSIKGITLTTSIGPLLIKLESYSITAYENAIEEVYRAVVTDSQGVFPDLVKDFSDNYDRQNFIDNFDTERGRFQVAINGYQKQTIDSDIPF